MKIKRTFPLIAVCCVALSYAAPQAKADKILSKSEMDNIRGRGGVTRIRKNHDCIGVNNGVGQDDCPHTAFQPVPNSTNCQSISPQATGICKKSAGKKCAEAEEVRCIKIVYPGVVNVDGNVTCGEPDTSSPQTQTTYLYRPSSCKNQALQ